MAPRPARVQGWNHRAMGGIERQPEPEPEPEPEPVTPGIRGPYACPVSEFRAYIGYAPVLFDILIHLMHTHKSFHFIFTSRFQCPSLQV
eukprot:COSAG06_NODE_15556_length_1062_cov_1.043614_2_plen_89_part_00